VLCGDTAAGMESKGVMSGAIRAENLVSTRFQMQSLQLSVVRYPISPTDLLRQLSIRVLTPKGFWIVFSACPAVA